MTTGETAPSIVWDYLVMQQGTWGAEELQRQLQALGAPGWEVCGFGFADRTIGLNALITLLKRPIAGYPVPTDGIAAWHADPAGRHERRWFDGTWWTAHVLDGDQANVDPPKVR